MLTPSRVFSAALNVLGAQQAAASPQSVRDFVTSPTAWRPAVDAYVTRIKSGKDLSDYRAGSLHSAARVFSDLIDASASPEEKPLFDALRRELDPSVRTAHSFREFVERKSFDPEAAALGYLAGLAELIGYDIPLSESEHGTFFARQVCYDDQKNNYARLPLSDRALVHKILLSSSQELDAFLSPKYMLMRRIADEAFIFVLSDSSIAHNKLAHWSLKTDAGAVSIDGATELIAAGHVHTHQDEKGGVMLIDGRSGSFPTLETSIKDNDYLPNDTLQRFAEDAGLRTAMEALMFAFPEFCVDTYRDA